MGDQFHRIDAHLELLLLTAPRGDVVDAGRGAQNQADGPILQRAQIHVVRCGAGLGTIQLVISAFDGIPEHLSEARRVRAHLRFAIPSRQPITNLLKALVDQLTGEVDVHAVVEIHRHERQAEQAHRADLFHLGQAGQG